MWGAQQKNSFQTSKKLHPLSQLLVDFNPELELVLTYEASAYGIGAVLAHIMPGETEKPVSYVSCTLTKAEKNYS